MEKLASKVEVKMVDNQKDKYNNFNIYLSEEQLREYAEIFSDTFEQKISYSMIQAAYDEIREIESGMIGRFGGPIEDLLLLYFMRYFSSMMDEADDGIHLEIGTLFGGTAIVSHRASEGSGFKKQTFLIDPLEGYYGQNLDPVAKIPVDEATVVENFEKFGINHKQDIVLLKGFSQEDTIMSKTSSKRVLSLFIDGDHSYTGVSNDWYNYSPMVVKGGYVLVDNFNDATWPCVTFFMDNMTKTMSRNCWSVKRVFNRSILLQKDTDSREKEKERADFLTKEQIQKFEAYLDEKVNKLLIRIDYRDKELEKAKIKFDAKNKELREVEGGLEKIKDDLRKVKIMVDNRNKTINKANLRIDSLEKELDFQRKELKAALKKVGDLSERLNFIPSILIKVFNKNTWIIKSYRRAKSFFRGQDNN